MEKKINFTSEFITKWWNDELKFQCVNNPVSEDATWTAFDSGSTHLFFKSSDGYLLKIDENIDGTLGNEIAFYQSVKTGQDCFFEFYLFDESISNSDYPQLKTILFKYEIEFISAWDDLLDKQLNIFDSNLYTEILDVGCGVLGRAHLMGINSSFMYEDFHLGQFGFVSTRRPIIFDFEGLPVKGSFSLMNRWMDYACLIRSLSYSWRIVQNSLAVKNADKLSEGRLEIFSEPPVTEWCIRCFKMVLDRDPTRAELKIIFQLMFRRCHYEVNYENSYRPEFAWIPIGDYKQLLEVYKTI